jgi:hypothetical protein
VIKLSATYRETLPLLIVFFFGVSITAAFFVDIPALSDFASTMQSYASVIISFAFIVALVGLARRHFTRFVKEENAIERGFGIMMIVVIVAYVAIGVGLGQNSELYQTIWNFYMNIRGVLYGMWMFFYSSAAYRTLRVRSTESLMLAFAGVIMLMANATIYGVIWPGFSQIGEWLMKVVNTGVVRAIIMGAAFGAVIRSIRILYGMERSYLGIAQEE